MWIHLSQGNPTTVNHLANQSVHSATEPSYRVAAQDLTVSPSAELREEALYIYNYTVPARKCPGELQEQRG